MRETLEKLGAIARCALLWPRTATLRKQSFLTSAYAPLAVVRMIFPVTGVRGSAATVVNRVGIL